jgi:hypothetical protein
MPPHIRVARFENWLAVVARYGQGQEIGAAVRPTERWHRVARAQFLLPATLEILALVRAFTAVCSNCLGSRPRADASRREAARSRRRD